MSDGQVSALYVCFPEGKRMEQRAEVEAIVGGGLNGDGYPGGVRIINGIFFKKNTGFDHWDSGYNVVTHFIALASLIGRRFQIGNTAIFWGEKYCEPCYGTDGFKEEFFDCGGVVGKVLYGGIIRTVDPVILLPEEAGILLGPRYSMSTNSRA